MVLLSELEIHNMLDFKLSLVPILIGLLGEPSNCLTFAAVCLLDLILVLVSLSIPLVTNLGRKVSL